MTTPVIQRRVFTAPRRPAAPEGREGEEVLPASPFAGVEWSIAFIAFLIYVASITTQRFAIGTATMGVALFTLMLERRPIRYPPVVLWSIALLAWGFIGWTTTEYPDLVLDRLIEFAKVCGVIFVGVNVITTRGRLRTLLIVMIVCLWLYPIRGTLLNYISGETLQGRVIWNGIYNNPNDLAGLCILQLAIVLGMLEVERARWVKLLLIPTALVLPLIILLTQSRGAFIALAVFGVIVGRKHARSVRAAAVLGAVLIALFVLTPDSAWTRLGTIGQSTPVDQREMTEAEASAAQRLEILRVAEAVIAANPITGVGVGAYGDAHFVYSQSPRFDPIARGHKDTHNTYLNLMAEMGLVGFACFAALVVATLRDARRARAKLRSAQPALVSQLFYFEVGAYGYLIAGLWGSYGQLVFTYFLFAIVCAAARLLALETIPRVTSSARSSRPGSRRLWLRPSESR
ncbi:MAG: O-antigen ligase family protein [Gemmatimonadaceae bacterium]